MYAKSNPGDVYHLLAPDEQNTLCGLAVAPIIIDGPAETSWLHLTVHQPVDLELCSECARISKSKQD